MQNLDFYCVQNMFKILLYIFVGGGAGSVCRFLMQNLCSKINIAFPFGTLVVNILGGLIIGFLTAVLTKNAGSEGWRFLTIVGFCGGFTTFSAFSLEGFKMLHDGQVAQFLLYAALSVALCLIFVWAGHALGARFTT